MQMVALLLSDKVGFSTSMFGRLVNNQTGMDVHYIMLIIKMWWLVFHDWVINECFNQNPKS